jgi:6-pyruvoyltetrahydropterin/6-carboxytetrahydropterin synthase
MFEVTVEQTFAAGHALRHYKGKCENVHGHNYRVQVTAEGDQLNSIGLLVDFVELKRVVRQVVDTLDHQFINDLEPFTVINPSAENIAKYFYDQVIGGLDLSNEAAVRISQVKVWETDTSIAVYRPLTQEPID